MSQAISNKVIDMVSPEYSGLSAKMVDNLKHFEAK